MTLPPQPGQSWNCVPVRVETGALFGGSGLPNFFRAVSLVEGMESGAVAVAGIFRRANAGDEQTSGAKIKEILDIEKGDRPDPLTYMTQVSIDAYLARFNDGAVRFFKPHSSGTIGPSNAFVFPKSYLDELYAATGGDMRAIERKLGMPQGHLDGVQAAVIESPDVRMPTGNEIGAFQGHWTPGGYTSNGAPEAVIHGQLLASDVAVKTPQELFNGS